MKDLETRRIVPMSVLAIVVFIVLGVFELLIIGGVLELNAATVKRVAPWAYEPFLKLVGEHPDLNMEAAAPQEEGKGRSGEISAIGSVAGFGTEEISVGVDTNFTKPVDVPLEPVTVPSESTEEVAPVGPSTNPPQVKPEDVVPVG